MNYFFKSYFHDAINIVEALKNISRYYRFRLLYLELSETPTLMTFYNV